MNTRAAIYAILILSSSFMLSVKASPTEERQVISDFMVAANASDYPRLETILASPHANPQQLLYIAFTQNLYTGIRMLTDRGVRLEAQTLTALLEVAVLRQMPVAQMEIFLQYSTAPINRDLLVAPFYKAMQMGRIDAIVFFLTKLPLLTHDFVGRHAGQALNQAELQKDALVIQQILKIGTAEFFRYFLTHYPKNMPHSDENRAVFQRIASKHNRDSRELLALLIESGLAEARNTQPEKGVPLDKLMELYPKWPLAEEPQVCWKMSYFPDGVYEQPDGSRVIISDGKDGTPELSLPVPPILQRRRRHCFNLWMRRTSPVDIAAAANSSSCVYPSGPAVATTHVRHKPAYTLPPLPPLPMALPSTIVDVPAAANSAQHVVMQPQARSTAPDATSGVRVFTRVTTAANPIGGEGLPKCDGGHQCPRMGDPEHRDKAFHPCRYGERCQLLLEDNPQSRVHKRRFRHPEGIRVAETLLGGTDAANTSAVAATPNMPASTTLIEQPVETQTSAVAAVSVPCWAERYACFSR